ncbi:MAG: nicotinate-nucleotide adenylyltransferase, partial [Pseudohongiellaceae bacterium]
VAWLGGSFDPVHNGHLAIAGAAAEQLKISRVLMIPAAIPPHKRDRRLASAADRMALLQVACASDSRLQPCDIELRREGPSYSYDTAVELRSQLGKEAALYFIVGADTLQDLGSWYRIADLAALCTFCAVTRPGSSLDPSFLKPLIGADAVERIAKHVIAAEPHPAASTTIREALAQGTAPEHLPAGVYEAIVDRSLYGAGGS